MPKDGGGTAKVSTFMTEIVADAIYLILKDVDFGNTSTPSYFVSTGESILFSSNTPKVVANATLSIGVPSNTDYSGKGSMWTFVGQGFTRPVGDGGTLLIYGSLIHFKTSSVAVTGSAVTVFDSIIVSITGTRVNNWLNYDCANSYRNVYHFNLSWLDLRGTFPLSEKVWVENCTIGFLAFSTVTITDFKITNFEGGRDYQSSSDADLTIKNPQVPVVSPWIFGNGFVKEVYTFNLLVKDKDDVNLENVTCLLEDKDDSQAFSVSTAADGTITEQTVEYRAWLMAGTPAATTEYSPHKLTLSKANYETLVIDEITMDEVKDLQFELLPALAVGDVRLNTGFGESKTGTLDLPAITDVEKGVVFDSTTKTGTFKRPIVTNVRNGSQYGAGDTEFTGTLDLPAITDVEKDVVFDSTTKTGTFKEPGIANVREGVQYGAGDIEFTGTLEVITIVAAPTPIRVPGQQQAIPQIAEAIRDYLITNQVDIIGKSGTVNVIIDEFNEDTPLPAVKIVENAGLGGDKDIPSMSYASVYIWTRAKDVEQARLLIRKIDKILHRYGPGLISEDVYIWSMLRNTNPQRLDDPDANLPQYFILYDVICRETIGGV